MNEIINNDLKEAMKSKDSFKLGVIRMVKGALQLEKISKKKELSDEEVIDVIAKQIKIRKDSANEFEKAGRMDLAESTKKEIEILSLYMPEQLSNDELVGIINEVFDIVKPSSAKDMGVIMREVTPKVRGKADMGEVSKIIKEKLNNL